MRSWLGRCVSARRALRLSSPDSLSASAGVLGGFLSLVRARAAQNTHDLKRLFWSLWDAANTLADLDASSAQVLQSLAARVGKAIRFAGNRPRWITSQKEDSPVGLGRQRQLVIGFLYLAQTECRGCRVDGIPKRLTDRYDFGIGPAGRSTVALELIGIAQRPVSGSAERQVVGCRYSRPRRDWARMVSASCCMTATVARMEAIRPTRWTSSSLSSNTQTQKNRQGAVDMLLFILHERSC